MKNIPPTYFFMGIVVAIAPYLFLTRYNVIAFPFNWLGSVPLLVGLVLVVLTRNELEKYHTPHNFSASTVLVRSGVYSFSRNPMYLGMILVLAGIAILVQNPFSLFAPVFFFMVIEFKFIPFEEGKMGTEIGEPYMQYKQSVRRWI